MSDFVAGKAIVRDHVHSIGSVGIGPVAGLPPGEENAKKSVGSTDILHCYPCNRCREIAGTAVALSFSGIFLNLDA